MDLSFWIYLILARFLQVQVNEGNLEGSIALNQYGWPFLSFKGIPYAEPPIGDLRFKAPQRKKPWKGVRLAKEFGASCFSYDNSINNTQPLPTSISEDCLYINVYTPNIKPIKPLPVMVYIHGGGFIKGNGNYKPDFLVRKNVILVTFNYRLEVLGFLSLDSEEIPGNAGMKDQVAALKWVKRNIQNFGGDIDNITIFGNSAGGACVSFHLISPMSKGLFNRAITQSGTVTSWWSYTPKARDRALLLAKELGCNSTDNKEIYKFFKAQPMHNLVCNKTLTALLPAGKKVPLVYFGVVQEKEFLNNKRFFYGHPYDVLRKGIHKEVEVINGYTEDEGIIIFSSGVDANKIFDKANSFSEFFAPEPFTTNTSPAIQKFIGRKFKEYYMKNQTVTKNTLDNFIKFISMEQIVYGTLSQQKLISRRNKNKSYLYKFACKTELNMFTSYIGVSSLFDYRPVVAHADELGYIFQMENVDIKTETFEFIDQMTTLWTNFAKYGDPTPDDSLGVKWLPYTLKDEDYLEISDKLVSKRYPEKKDFHFWKSNFVKYLPRFVP